MAKRKLSPEKRAALREDLKAGVASKQKTADLLREVAKKYGVTTITARWYLQGLYGKKKQKSGASKGTRGPGRPKGGSNAKLVKLVEGQARDAKEAGRLIPLWQKAVARESALRNMISKVGRKLAATAKKVGMLRSRIDHLVRA